ncbi:unnamed protein product [Lampetra fluviatilis]
MAESGACPPLWVQLGSLLCLLASGIACVSQGRAEAGFTWWYLGGAACCVAATFAAFRVYVAHRDRAARAETAPAGT